MGLPILPVLPLAAAAVTLLPARNPRYRLLHAVTAAAVVAVAAARLAPGAALPPPNSVAHLTGSHVAVLARADADGDPHPTYTAVTVRVEQVDRDGAARSASGRLLVYLPAVPATPSGEVRAGDELRLDGQIEPTAAGAHAGYAAYLETRGIAGVLAFPRLAFVGRPGESPPRALLRSIRSRIEGGLATVLPPREAALAQALVFGNRHALPADLLSDLRATGTIHIATFSAFNVLVLYGALLALLAPLLGRRRAAIVAAAAALGYGAVAGGGVSAARGEAIVGLLALATVSGRPYSSVALLSLAAAALCLTNPRLPADAGFQLTFSAAAGVAVLAPSLRRAVARMSDGTGQPAAAWRGLVDGLVMSLAVTVAIIPAVAAQSGTVNLWSPLANALVNPLLPPLMALAVAAGALASLAQPLGWIAAAPLWAALRATQPLLHALAVAPLSALALPRAGVLPALGWYALLAALLALAPTIVARLPQRRSRTVAMPHPRWLPRSRAAPLPLVAIALAVVVALATPFPLMTAGAGKQAETTASWLDVTGPPALLVTGRNGVRALVTDNAEPAAIAQALQTRTGDGRGVDLIAELRGGDHAAAAALAGAVHARVLLFPNGPSAGGADVTVQPHGTQPGVRLVSVGGRATIDLGGGGSLELLTGGKARAVELVAGGRRVVVAGAGGGLSNLLARWDGAQTDPDVVVLPPLAGKALRDVLASVKPHELVLAGRWSAADEVIARATAARAGSEVADAAPSLVLAVHDGRFGTTVTR